MKNFLLMMVLAVIVCACGTQHAAMVRSPRYQDGGSDKSFDATNFQQKSKEKRVVLYNARLQVVTENADSLNVQLAALAKRYDGYVITLGNKSSAIRVNAKSLNAAISEMGTITRIKSKTISGDDVTEQYNDYTLRLDNATRARTRYLELLAKAETVEATLAVEKELERLNGEIESMKGKLARYDHLEEFSTIDVGIEEKQKLGILGYVTVGLYKSVRWLFIRG